MELESGDVQVDLGVPEVGVAVARKVGPHQRGDGRDQQHDSAGHLDVQESAHRSTDAAGYRSLAGQPGREGDTGLVSGVGLAHDGGTLHRLGHDRPGRAPISPMTEGRKVRADGSGPGIRLARHSRELVRRSSSRRVGRPVARIEIGVRRTHPRSRLPSAPMGNRHRRGYGKARHATASLGPMVARRCNEAPHAGVWDDRHAAG